VKVAPVLSHLTSSSVGRRGFPSPLPSARHQPKLQDHGRRTSVSYGVLVYLLAHDGLVVHCGLIVGLAIDDRRFNPSAVECALWQVVHERVSLSPNSIILY